MLKNLFKKKEYVTVKRVSINSDNEFDIDVKPNVPEGKWVNCSKCKNIIYTEDLHNNSNVCINCGYHFKIGAKSRIAQVFDYDSFVPLFDDITSNNPLDFKGYEGKLESNKEKSNINEAVITGYGTIFSKKTAVAVMDSNFMMGSMGCAVGEKITRLVEYATEDKMSVIIFTASGGARMQEGIFSLMQMAKISQAIAKHGEEGLLYLSVITNPTTGGVTASFAMQGDIIISEPDAVIGFAGRRVIEGTIGQNLPDDFQSAEFSLEKGFVDAIVARKDMKKYISKILSLHGVSKNV
ncbi:MAG: acetyl-CoA carboxylase, carboxyltransferase subunit beta [Romboutsia sp.]